MINPLFKWAGGKKKMLAKYEKEVFTPKELKCETFVDMFAGAGTMALWAYQNRERLGLKRIVLNDVNFEIIHMYRMMKSDIDGFILTCQELEKDYFQSDEYEFRKQVYLRWRTVYADGRKGLTPMKKAAYLFCMLKTNFNGIWQSRAADGVYFTPFGNGKEAKAFINPDEIIEFKNMLDIAEITCLSFEETENYVGNFESAFFYADPPYLASFTKYKRKKGEVSFGPAETEKLVKFLARQGERGSKFALSNKQHEFFEGFEGITVFSNIKYTASRKDTANATSDEILWTNL